MVISFLNRNNDKNFIVDEVDNKNQIKEKVAIEKSSDPFELNSISSNDLINQYKHIKLLAINPNQKNKLENLTKEIREDLQKLSRIINIHF